MSIADVLIIVGCLAAGYWIVNSVMGPSSKTPPPQAPSSQAPSSRATPSKPRSLTAPKAIASSSSDQPRLQDASTAAKQANLSNWYLILDVSEFAKRDEITSAYKRKIAQLKGDPHAAQSEAQLRAAYDMGMRLFR